MTNDEIAEVFNAIYFGWWKACRDTTDPATLDTIMDSGIDLVKKYNGEPLAYHMIDDLVQVLIDRMGDEDARTDWQYRRKMLVADIITELGGEMSLMTSDDKMVKLKTVSGP